MADATSPTDLLSLLNALRSVRTVSLAPSGDQGAGAGSAIPAGLPPNVVNYMRTAPSVSDGQGQAGYGNAGISAGTRDPMPTISDNAPQAATAQPISDLLTALRASASLAPLLARVGGAPAPAAAAPVPPPGAAADYARRGFIQSTPYLNPAVAPRVPAGAARPLGPGEWIRNPDGSWSSEESTTVSRGDNLDLMGGKATVIPTLWIKDGKPYMASEDEAQQLAVQSGLSFPTFADTKAAEAFANQREAIWEKTPDGHSGAQDPLWSYPKGSEYIEPPATPTATAGEP